MARRAPPAPHHGATQGGHNIQATATAASTAPTPGSPAVSAAPTLAVRPPRPRSGWDAASSRLRRATAAASSPSPYPRATLLAHRRRAGPPAHGHLHRPRARPGRTTTGSGWRHAGSVVPQAPPPWTAARAGEPPRTELTATAARIRRRKEKGAPPPPFLVGRTGFWQPARAASRRAEASVGAGG